MAKREVIKQHKVIKRSDGKYWGEMLLSYDIEAVEDQKELKFKVVKSTLYSPR